jgi:hypothetical protein
MEQIPSLKLTVLHIDEEIPRFHYLFQDTLPHIPGQINPFHIPHAIT